MLKQYFIFAVTEGEKCHLIRLENKQEKSDIINLGGCFDTWEDADLIARLIDSSEIKNVEYVSMR